ncbi:hypothetical protein [Mycobacteroides sp. CBMA 326]|uniref:hypothetical protein n=1 Tax=Mycobacteroides sp. CBMA 326 TaxID=1904945 RepID=UPI0028161F21|nr:hypothetical protein [Mycobacteroides sp. CBMA 326]
MSIALSALVVLPPNVATAEPAGFPDLNTFADVPAQAYIQKWPRSAPTVSFSTEEGINCGFGAPETPNEDNQFAFCDGPLPGLQNVPARGSGPCDIGSVNSFGISHTQGACEDARPNWKILSPGHKLSYGNITCAVGRGPVVACVERIAHKRGFVLQPSGSFVF